MKVPILMDGTLKGRGHTRLMRRTMVLRRICIEE
jgi:hypothetical protein